MTTTPDHPAYAADRLADHGARVVRRTVNQAIHAEALQRGLDPETRLDFVCECGSLACSETIPLELSAFDPAAPGAILAHP